MRHLFFAVALLSFLLIANTYTTKAQVCAWAKQGGCATDAAGRSLVTDAEGNVFELGFYDSDTMWFGISYVVRPDSFESIYVAKYDSAGNFQWAKTFGGGIIDHTALGMAKDGSGNLYVAGTFTDATLVFGSTVILNPTGTGLFLLKLDNTGSIIWVKNASAYGTSGSSEAVGVSTDPSGNIFIAGYYADSVTFGSTKLSNPAGAGSNVFLVKYDPTGSVVWAKDSHGLGGGDVATSIATDGSGNIFISGFYTSGSISFDGVTFATGIGENLFIVKYDATGHAVWGHNAIDSNYVESTGLTTDAAGNVFVCGSFDGTTVAFGSTTLTNPGGTGGHVMAFVAKYDNTGILQWAKTPGGSFTHDDFAYSITTDAGGDVYMGGLFTTPTVTFGGTTLTNFGPFIVKYNAAGDVQWAKGAASTTWGSVYSLCRDGFGHLYATGGFNMPLTFDAITLPSPMTGYVEAFTARFDHVTTEVENVNEPIADVTVYPNPVHDVLTVCASHDIGKMIVTNILEQVVFSGTSSSEKVQVDVSGWAPGVYFVKVNPSASSGQVEVRKFVKE